MVEIIKRLTLKINYLEFLKSSIKLSEEQIKEINEKQEGYKAQKTMFENILQSRQEKVA